MICLVDSVTGERLSVPIDAPAVYQGEGGELAQGEDSLQGIQIVGGSSKELAQQICHKIRDKVAISDLSSFVGVTADGQYLISPDFANELLSQVSSPDPDSPFALPVSWDPAHFLNLAVTDVRDGKGDFKESSVLFERLIKRLNVLNNELNYGKGNAILQIVKSASQLTAHNPTAYCARGLLPLS